MSVKAHSHQNDNYKDNYNVNQQMIMFCLL